MIFDPMKNSWRAGWLRFPAKSGIVRSAYPNEGNCHSVMSRINLNDTFAVQNIGLPKQARFFIKNFVS